MGRGVETARQGDRHRSGTPSRRLATPRHVGSSFLVAFRLLVLAILQIDIKRLVVSSLAGSRAAR
jgi:hypothetical protein